MLFTWKQQSVFTGVTALPLSALVLLQWSRNYSTWNFLLAVWLVSCHPFFPQSRVNKWQLGLDLVKPIWRVHRNDKRWLQCQCQSASNWYEHTITILYQCAPSHSLIWLAFGARFTSIVQPLMPCCANANAFCGAVSFSGKGSRPVYSEFLYSICLLSVQRKMVHLPNSGGACVRVSSAYPGTVVCRRLRHVIQIQSRRPLLLLWG